MVAGGTDDPGFGVEGNITDLVSSFDFCWHVEIDFWGFAIWEKGCSSCWWLSGT